MVEVEVLQRLAGREAGGADAALAAVGFAGGDLALQAGGQELLVGPALGPGPFGQPRDRGSRSDGAFSARVRKASSAVTFPRGGLGRRGRPSRDLARRQAEDGVVVGQVAAAATSVAWPAAVTPLRRSVAAQPRRRPAAWAGSVMVWWRAQQRSWSATSRPSQDTPTCSRSAPTSTRRPTAAGCTE